MIYIRRTISALIVITLFALAIWGFTLLPYQGMITIGSVLLVFWAVGGYVLGIVDEAIKTFQPKHYMMVGPVGAVFLFLHWLFKSWVEEPPQKRVENDKPSTF